MWFGSRCRARESLGVVPQELALYEELSASENLSYWAEAYGVVGRDRKARVSQLLEVIGLIDRANEPVR